ncbi:hypothetical protein CDL12_06468 [Handroanthus impetiginosus]|uniref:CASP-like protein n=1 Tax=Handroanthus impetiginosus TaxID=429701 RepID=A0A2G9HU45_9LAMI|nr:hypothetical protein CDL12_06468 [Handroanthus impetiginosus]
MAPLPSTTNSLTMAPPPSTTISPIVILIVRVLTFISLLFSVIIIATNTATSTVATSFGLIDIKINFSAFYAYRYMVATGVIGMAYALLQTAFTIFYVTTGTRFGGDGLAFLDFYGDKVFSYLLATGAGAGFGLTVDLKQNDDSETNSFLNKAIAAASLLLIGFIFSAISSVFSSLSLSKKAV